MAYPWTGCQEVPNPGRVRLIGGGIWPHCLQKFHGLFRGACREDWDRQRDEVRYCAVGQKELYSHGDRGCRPPWVSGGAVWMAHRNRYGITLQVDSAAQFPGLVRGLECAGIITAG